MISFSQTIKKVQSLTGQPIVVSKIDSHHISLSLSGMSVAELERAMLYLMKLREIPKGKISSSDQFVTYHI